MDPVKDLCDRLIRAFAELVRSAGPGSKIAVARDTLGSEAFADLACESMRRHVNRVLLDEREATAETIRVPYGMQLVAADVLAAVIKDVGKAAEPLTREAL